MNKSIVAGQKTDNEILLINSENCKDNLRQLKQYTYPKLHTGKDWYVMFMAFDPITRSLKRKRIRINNIGSAKQKREYANDLILRLSDKLRSGWNPFVDEENSKQYALFEVAVDQYITHIVRMCDAGNLRSNTMANYKVFLKLLRNYNDNTTNKITYIYQFNTGFVGDFLDWCFLVKRVAASSRNCYLDQLKSFSGYLIEKQYIKINPCNAIKKLKITEKNRTVIQKKDIMVLKEYLEKNNAHFLLACYLLFYCFIRPKEMTFIKISWIDKEKSILTIYANASKNRKTSTVTIPQVVIDLMIKLDIFRADKDYFLLSDAGLRPGRKQFDRRKFNYLWKKTAKYLKFPETYKFYSLKDTGITEMIKENIDPVTVRDQARHHSIDMTNKYIEASGKEANSVVKNRKGSF